MSVRYRFPDRLRGVGWLLAVVGVIEAAYTFVLQWTAGNLAEDKMKDSLPQARMLLLFHMAIAIGYLVAGIAVIGKRYWAWVMGLLLVIAGTAVAALDLAMGSAKTLQAATSFPQPLVLAAVLALDVVLLIALILYRPHPLSAAVAPSKVEAVDEHTMAVIEATKKMSSRQSEDWGAEADDEELLESLIWMTQLRQGGAEDGVEPDAARQAEDQRRIQRLPSVFDASPMAIAVTDPAGTVTLWNQAAERLFGHDAKEALGRTLPLGRPVGDTDTQTLLAQAVQDGSVIGVESDYTRKDGSLVPVSMSISVLPDVERQAAGFIVVFTDLTHRREALAQELSRRQEEALEATQAEIYNRIAEVGELVDATQGKHARRVTAIVTLVARQMGYPPEEAIQLGRAALLHDIGKVGVPSEIWNKQGRLTDEEFEAVKTHAEAGRAILSSTQSPLMQMAADIAYSHHERWDGFGYLGLVGANIPVGARIVAVADAFDAITHDRPYRKARSIQEAADIITAESGKQFDPAVVDAFLAVLNAGHLEAINQD